MKYCRMSGYLARRYGAAFRGSSFAVIAAGVCATLMTGCGSGEKPEARSSTPAPKRAESTTQVKPPSNVEPQANLPSKTAAPVMQAEPKTVEPTTNLEPNEGSKEWMSLFDGKSLAGWKVTDFGGEGEVHVDDGSLLLELGSDLTGVTITREVPRVNYEVELQAMRVEGSDFFCGLTFPVKDDPCSLIIGGWGGGVCGLSSLDGFDASENETTTYKEFQSGRWYPVRLQVTDDKIAAWLDGEQIVDVETKGRKFSVRIEVERSRPFGLACWRTKAALRDIRVRELPPSKK